MKALVYLMTIATTAIGAFAPMLATAQNLPKPGVAGIPFGGFYSTIIYTPSPNNVTTTVTTQLSTGDGFLGSYDRPTVPLLLPRAPSHPINLIPYQRPIVIYQRERNYPPALGTNCISAALTNSVLSAAAIAVYTGKYCDADDRSSGIYKSINRDRANSNRGN